MVNNKILILGDPHIGKGCSIGKQSLGFALNSRIIDQLEILNWVFEQSLERGIRTIVITGDMFEDPKPANNLVLLVIEWLQKCSDANINVHILLGNHDLLRSGNINNSVLDLISAANIDGVSIHKVINTINLENVAITMLPFRDRRSFNLDSGAAALSVIKNRLQYELAEISANSYKIVVGHLAIDGSLFVGDEIDDMANELFCPLSILHGYEYAFFGHIHKFQIMSQEKPHISHIGSMDISDFGESEQEKFVAIFDPSQDDPLQYIKVPTRKLRQISISVPSEISKPTSFILDKLANDNYNKSIIKLNILLNNVNSVSIDRKMIENLLMERGVFHIARISEERKVSIVKQPQSQDIDSTMNELTAIKLYANSNIDDKCRDKFISLAADMINEYKSEKQV